MMNKNYVFNLNKLIYICCARPNGRTVGHITFYLDSDKLQTENSSRMEKNWCSTTSLNRPNRNYHFQCLKTLRQITGLIDLTFLCFTIINISAM